MASSEDRALMERVSAGDRAAREVLARRLLPRVTTVVRYLAWQSSEAPDLVQVSLIEILRSTSSWRGDSSIETWADSITARTTWRSLRRLRRVAATVEVMEDVPESADAIDGDEATRRLLLRRRLAELLQALPVEHRAAVVYKYVEGFSLEEIAQLTGAAVNTVRNRLLMGKARLRELLAGREEVT